MRLLSVDRLATWALPARWTAAAGRRLGAGIRLAALALAVAAASGQAQAAPDIVIMLIDDLGPSLIGPERRSVNVATPNIDALGAAGTTYTQGYSAPACVPTRTMLLVGRWPYRNSVGAVWNNGPQPPGSVVTIAERLRARGYATAAIGKWHLGFTGGRHPLDQGFDQFLGFKGITPNYYGHDPEAPLYRDRAAIRNTGYVTDTLADEAVRILTAKRTRPLFLYVPLTAIHAPLQTTLPFAISGVDRAVGRIVAAAKKDTLFIFAGDNGCKTNAPLRCGKFSIYEGGVRVPFVMRWSGHVGAGKSVATPVSLLDIPATAMAAAGATVPAELDGLNLLRSVPATRNVYFGAFGRAGYGIRQGKWKFYKDYEGITNQLYDLLADKGETKNVASRNPKVVNTLTAAINAWKKTIDD